jgi:4-amino-4-deoxy-L-arabinose transferase-like glycosyltransferase
VTFLVLTFIRIGIAYLSGYHGTDITDHLKASRGLLQGQSLYFDVRFDYVPLHAYLQAFFLKLLGDSVLSSKLPALIGDIGFAIVFYLIGKEVNENFGRKLSLAYLFLPLRHFKWVN